MSHKGWAARPLALSGSVQEHFELRVQRMPAAVRQLLGVLRITLRVGGMGLFTVQVNEDKLVVSHAAAALARCCAVDSCGGVVICAKLFQICNCSVYDILLLCFIKYTIDHATLFVDTGLKQNTFRSSYPDFISLICSDIFL